MSDEKTLRKLVLLHGAALSIKAPWANGVALLAALAEAESWFGVYNIPKYEPAYDSGGRYFDHKLWMKWGSWAACSYSSWQIMYPVAIELGFDGRPQDLWDDETAIHWVMEYIDRRILKRGCNTVEQFADAYNSGSFKDRNVPELYIEKFVGHYRTVIERRNLIQGG